jgi:hypothetical protein
VVILSKEFPKTKAWMPGERKAIVHVVQPCFQLIQSSHQVESIPDMSAVFVSQLCSEALCHVYPPDRRFDALPDTKESTAKKKQWLHHAQHFVITAL